MEPEDKLEKPITRENQLVKWSGMAGLSQVYAGGLWAVLFRGEKNLRLFSKNGVYLGILTKGEPFVKKSKTTRF